MKISDNQRVLSFMTTQPTQMAESFRVNRQEGEEYLRRKLGDDAIRIELKTSGERYFLVITFGNLEAALSFYQWYPKLLDVAGWKRFFQNIVFLKVGDSIPDALTRINPE